MTSHKITAKNTRKTAAASHRRHEREAVASPEDVDGSAMNEAEAKV
jgi:hypothetical protein